MCVVRMSRPVNIATQVRADVASWPLIRQRLYNVFKAFRDAGYMTALYGQRTDEQIRAAIEYANEV